MNREEKDEILRGKSVKEIIDAIIAAPGYEESPDIILKFEGVGTAAIGPIPFANLIEKAALRRFAEGCKKCEDKNHER